MIIKMLYWHDFVREGKNFAYAVVDWQKIQVGG
jgi:hypothetical protein